MRFYPPNPGPGPYRPYQGPGPYDSFFVPFPPNQRLPYQHPGSVYQDPRYFSQNLTQRPPQGAPIPPQRSGELGSFLQDLTQGPSLESAPPPQAPDIPSNLNIPPQAGDGNPPQTPGMWENINQMLAYADEIYRGINTLRQIGSVFTKK